MAGNISSEWAVFFLVGAFFSFVIYAAIKSKLPEKKGEKEQGEGKGKV